VSDIELYEIASTSERELHAKNASSIADPARRRETKIKQYQAEKEIRSRIEVTLSAHGDDDASLLPLLHRPSRYDSHPRIPPRPTLTSSPPFFRPPPRLQPQSVTTSRTARTSGARLRSSCYGSPTRRHTPNSQASHRNSSSCVPRRRRLHLLHTRRYLRQRTRCGGSMRPRGRWGNGAAGRYSTPRARLAQRSCCGCLSCLYGRIAAVTAVHDVALWREQRPRKAARAGVPS
jgi:hypothetical protein